MNASNKTRQIPLGGRISRGPGGRGRPGRGPPERQGRDSEQSIDISEDLNVESTSSRFSYNGGMDGPNFTGEVGNLLKSMD